MDNVTSRVFAAVWIETTSALIQRPPSRIHGQLSVTGGRWPMLSFNLVFFSCKRISYKNTQD